MRLGKTVSCSQTVKMSQGLAGWWHKKTIRRSLNAYILLLLVEEHYPVLASGNKVARSFAESRDGALEGQEGAHDGVGVLCLIHGLQSRRHVSLGATPQQSLCEAIFLPLRAERWLSPLCV